MLPMHFTCIPVSAIRVPPKPNQLLKFLKKDIAQTQATRFSSPLNKSNLFSPQGQREHTLNSIQIGVK
eukprot:scaffold2416_cov116-Skeletonema_menzelii.AAC.2